MRARGWSFCFAAVLLQGCAGAPVAPATEALAHAPLSCLDTAQCELYWQRSRAWLAQYSRYGIQSASDAALVTYGPSGGNVWLAYKVTRNQDAGGGARIEISARCDNPIRCEPLPTEAMAAFKRYVRRE